MLCPCLGIPRTLASRMQQDQVEIDVRVLILLDAKQQAEAVEVLQISATW